MTSLSASRCLGYRTTLLKPCLSACYIIAPGRLNTCNRRQVTSGAFCNLGGVASQPLTAENNYATKSPLVTMRRPTFTPKLPIPFDDHHPHLLQPSLDRSHSPLQTASESNQPFCRSTLSRPTDRHTDRNRISDRSTPRTAYAL